MANFNRRITGSQAVIAVMKTLGLTAPTSIYDSTDKTVIQLWQLASEVGEKLLDEHDWEILGKEHTITTASPTLTYALPLDFNGFYPDSGWNRTSKFPVLGSMTEPEWQELKARSLGGTTIALLFQVSLDFVSFYAVPADAQTIVMPYMSRAWVVASDLVTYRDYLSTNSDVIQYDPQLFKVALKRAWMEAKRFDTAKVDKEYALALENAKAKDTVPRTLTLNNKSRMGGLLGTLNIPNTGLG